MQTHTTTNEGLYLALENEVDLLQHVDLTYGPEPLSAELVERLTNSRCAGALLPQTDSALAWYRDHVHLTPWLKRYEVMDANARAVINSGAHIALSTDGGVLSRNTLASNSWRAWQPEQESLLTLGDGHFSWLLAVEQKGMLPMDALRAATINIARAYRVDGDLGTLEVGKMADLVILDENPLKSARNYRTISRVMKSGVWVDRSSLPTERYLTAPFGSGEMNSHHSLGRLPCSMSHEPGT